MEVFMNAIKKHIYIESEIITIPELKNFIGKHMELILIEEEEEEHKKGMDNFFNLAGKVEFDEDKIRKLRETSKL